MNTRRFRGTSGAAVIAVAAVALSLTACASDGDSGGDAGGGATEDPYNILVLGGISAEGVLANNAATSVQSAEASANVINAAGGILGREVVVTVVDDQGDPTTAVTLVREAINSDDPPDAVLNSGPSTVADATIPILSQAGILSFNIGPTTTSSDPEQFPLNFDLSVSARDGIVGIAAFIEEEGYESVAILHGSSSYGESYGAGAEEVFGEAGFTVTGKQVYDVAALDMTAQLEALKATNPDVLMLDAYGAPLGYILQGIEKLAWDVPILGNTSVAATGLVSTEPPTGVLGTSQVENLLMQVYQSTAYNPDADLTNEAVQAMLELGPIKATLILAYNYDAVILIKAAAESVGSADDSEALAAALEDEAVTLAAPTAMLSHYIFSADKHSPNAGPEEFRMIPPSLVADGQYHPEG